MYVTTGLMKVVACEKSITVRIYYNTFREYLAYRNYRSYLFWHILPFLGTLVGSEFVADRQYFVDPSKSYIILQHPVEVAFEMSLLLL